jgi:hypothetical protein
LSIDAIRDSMPLDPLADRDWMAIFQTVLAAHQAAYGWTAPVDAAGLWRKTLALSPATDSPVRTRLRVAIAWLDLVWQYQRAPLAIQVGGMQRQVLTEDPEDEAAATSEA